MGVIPSLGKRGTQSTGSTSGTRDESIARVWTFLVGLVAKTIRLTQGASAGAVLTCDDDDGRASWGITVPHETSAGADATANETGVLVASATGTYLVTVYHEITTAGSAGTLTTTITHTDDVGTTSWQPAAPLPCSATGQAQGQCVVRCTAGDLEFAKAISGGVGSPHYRSHITAVKVST